MMWVVGILVVIVIVLALALYAVVTDPVEPSGAPTPEEARITNEAAQQSAAIVNDSAARKEVIQHEDRKSLFARARAKLHRK